MMNEGMDLARGYIVSGEFNGHGIPQHIQIQIVNHIVIIEIWCLFYLVQNIGLMVVPIASYGPHLMRVISASILQFLEAAWKKNRHKKFMIIA